MILTYESVLRDIIANTTNTEYKKSYLIVEEFEGQPSVVYAWLVVDSVVLHMVPGTSRENTCKRLLFYLVNESFKFGKEETLKNINENSNDTN